MVCNGLPNTFKCYIPITAYTHCTNKVNVRVCSIAEWPTSNISLTTQYSSIYVLTKVPYLKLFSVFWIYYFRLFLFPLYSYICSHSLPCVLVSLTVHWPMLRCHCLVSCWPVLTPSLHQTSWKQPHQQRPALMCYKKAMCPFLIIVI